MCATITEDDIEKTVENATGETIGTVVSVERGIAHVEPNPGLIGSIRSALGWTSVHGETVPVHEDDVGKVTDDVIRLEGDAPGAGEPTDAALDDSRGRRRTEGDESSDATFETPDGAAAESGTEHNDRASVSGTEATEGSVEGVPTDETGGPDPPRGIDEETDTTAETDIVDETNRGPRVGPTDEFGESKAVDEDDESDEAGVGDDEDEGVGDRESTDERDEGDGADEFEVVDESTAADVGDGLDELDELEGADGADEDRSDRSDPTDRVDERIEVDAIDELGRTAETSAAEEMGRADELDGERAADPAEVHSGGGVGRRSDADSTPGPTTTQRIPEGSPGEARRPPATDVDPAYVHDAAPYLVGSSRTMTADATLEREPEPGRSLGEMSVDSEPQVDDGRRDRDDAPSGSPVRALFAVQRAAIAQGTVPFRQALAAQRRADTVARSTLEGHGAVQREGLEFVRMASHGYLGAVAAMTGVRPAREQRRAIDEEVNRFKEIHAQLFDAVGEGLERRDEGGQDEQFERRLELVDGLDTMYRERLAEADIRSLDDLARADSETVADAAAVTEKRAESWIEQASA